MSEDTKSNIHAGHRERMRKRFIENGIEGFEPHEIIEMLLFYSVPRQNTNETAHALLEKFGTLNGVLAADFKDLVKVNGVKDNSATLIKLVSGIMRCAIIESTDTGIRYDRFEYIARYLINLYVGLSVERVYLLLFDNSLRMIDCINLGDGSVNRSSAIPRVIIEHALEKHASSVLLAHNHPGGIAIPSGDDIEYTHTLDNLLNVLGIVLIDHVIVAGNSVASIMNSRMGNFRPSPLNGKIDEDFYKTFYFDPLNDSKEL